MTGVGQKVIPAKHRERQNCQMELELFFLKDTSSLILSHSSLLTSDLLLCSLLELNSGCEDHDLSSVSAEKKELEQENSR